MITKNILNFNFIELQNYLENVLNIKKFRSNQICDWIYKKNIYDFNKMSNLSLENKEKLNRKLNINLPEIIEIKKSKIDNTKKYLFRLEDGELIESVIMKYPNRISACLSTQVGCALKCSFCSTGKQGFRRDLETSEIIGQFLQIEKNLNRKINNIVYMGMGEPLLNYNNVVKSIKMLNDHKMRELGGRHITVSTAGISHKIVELASIDIEIRLSVSLHAATNEKRDQIMPINSKHPIEELIQACKDYQKITNKRVTFEYTMIKGFNDTEKDANDLINLLSGIKSMINVIPVNPNPEGFEQPSKQFIHSFLRKLKSNNIDASLRAEKGTDIEAACGQLKATYQK